MDDNTMEAVTNNMDNPTPTTGNNPSPLQNQFSNPQITNANVLPDESHDAEPSKPAVLYGSYKSRLSLSLGTTQLILGMAAVIINAIGLALNFSPWNYTVKKEDGSQGDAYWEPTYAYKFGLAGFWAPVFFTLSGSLAIVAAKKKTSGVVMYHTVFAVLASLAAVGMFGISVWALAEDVKRLVNGMFVSYRNQPNDYDSYRDHYNTYENIPEAAARIKTLVGLSVAYVVVSFIELLACVGVASLGFKVMKGKDFKNCCSSFSCPCSCVFYFAYPKVQTPLLVLDAQGQPVQGAKLVQMMGVDKSGQPLYISRPELNQPTILVKSTGMVEPPQYEPSDTAPLLQRREPFSIVDQP